MFSPKHPQGQEMRYRLLEPIRQYLYKKLRQAGEVETLRDRHLAYFIHAADQAMLKPFQNLWSRRWGLLKNELENIRVALGWALSGPSSPRVEDGLRLAGCLGDFWEQGYVVTEGRAWLAKALDWTDGRRVQLAEVRARALESAAFLAALQKRLSETERLLNEGIALCRKTGDEWMLVLLLDHLSLWTSSTNLQGAQQAIAESVTIGRRVGDPVILAEALLWQGELLAATGNLESASQYYQESLDLIRNNGIRGGACYPLAALGRLALGTGDIDTALRYREDYQSCLQDIDDRSLNHYAIDFLLDTAYHSGNFIEMESLIQEIKDVSTELSQEAVDYWQHALGIAWKRQGLYQQAIALFFENLLLGQTYNKWSSIFTDLAEMAGIMVWMHQPVRAAHLFGAVATFFKNIQQSLEGLDRYECDRDVATLRNEVSEKDYDQAWAEGRMLTLEEAIGEARLITEELKK
jgi:tetratricopeptide (TPR) repeat protein